MKKVRHIRATGWVGEYSVTQLCDCLTSCRTCVRVHNVMKEKAVLNDSCKVERCGTVDLFCHCLNVS